MLRTAMRVFAEEGPEVSLSRIAQRAGVGAGTVYRHFPTKEILIEAVLAKHVEGLVSAADRWTAQATPGDALFGFLLEAIETSAGRRHFCDLLPTGQGWPLAVLTAAARRFNEALERLLRDAQEAGAVRADIRTDDLTALTVGGMALRSAHRDRARGTRLVRLLLDGLRPPCRRRDYWGGHPRHRRHEILHASRSVP
ncbi:TetR/AcrR family transcriptional regulator [Microbispora sp. RL4-1S]|uniref:TetR/AcrR family transcriptional regulator n=1 Tax=Microbispora oryzae TaxID=2806554 RepID=A0A941AFW3_9ACTN|nr:TetR/AcrR family transcriptional regulator [Microbispora oryzae]MBP2702371.1 TetR/AcrR family transcriptional regulator [Microbispora oryzae]